MTQEQVMILSYANRVEMFQMVNVTHIVVLQVQVGREEGDTLRDWSRAICLE